MANNFTSSLVKRHSSKAAFSERIVALNKDGGFQHPDIGRVYLQAGLFTPERTEVVFKTFGALEAYCGAICDAYDEAAGLRSGICFRCPLQEMERLIALPKYKEAAQFAVELSDASERYVRAKGEQATPRL